MFPCFLNVHHTTYISLHPHAIAAHRLKTAAIDPCRHVIFRLIIKHLLQNMLLHPSVRLTTILYKQISIDDVQQKLCFDMQSHGTQEQQQTCFHFVIRSFSDHQCGARMTSETPGKQEGIDMGVNAWLSSVKCAHAGIGCQEKTAANSRRCSKRPRAAKPR